VLKTNGFPNVFGLDMSENCVKNVKDLGIDCEIGGCFSIPEEFYGKFDMIILSQVMEHIYDIPQAMQNIICMLNDTGKIYIDVPDASRYYDFYIKPFHYFDLEHINHFDSQALINLSKKFNMEVIFSHEKETHITKKYSYPTISIIMKKSLTPANVDVTHIIKKGNSEQIKKYIAKSYDNDVVGKLNELIASQEKIIVWGVGSITLSIFEKGLAKCNIVAIVDADVKKQGMLINDLKVNDPSILKGFEVTIVITPALYQDEIEQKIIEMNTLNIVKSIY